MQHALAEIVGTELGVMQIGLIKRLQVISQFPSGKLVVLFAAFSAGSMGRIGYCFGSTVILSQPIRVDRSVV